MMTTELRNLRVDQVGSLLRPESLKAAFARHAQGLITEAELGQAQEEAIRDVIFDQEAHDLPVITDGEFRRAHFMESFGEVAGMELWKSRIAETIEALDGAESSSTGETKRGTDPTLHTRRPVTQRLRLLRNRPLGEYRFARQLSATPVKITLIDTDRICQGFDAVASHLFRHR